MADLTPVEEFDTTPSPTGFRLREHLPLFLLLACAAVVYILASAFQWVDLDESIYLGAAVSVLHGNIPFVTFAAREPVVIYWLAIGAYLFGPTLFVGRLMVDLLFLVAGAGVYATTSRVEGRWAGMAAAGFFLFNPFDVYYGSIITLEAAVAAPLAWMLYFLFRNSRARPVDLFIAGVLLGIAILTLRDSVLFLPLVFLVVTWQYRTPLSTVLYRIGAVSLGTLLTAGTVLLLFVDRTSLSWMWVEYGPGPGYFKHAQPFSIRLGVLGYTAVLEPALLLFLLLTPAVLLMIGKRPWWGNRLAELAGILVVSLPWLAVTYFTWGVGDLLFYGAALLGGLLLFAWFYGIRALARADWSVNSPAVHTILLGFCLGWVALVVLSDFLITVNAFVHRLLELSIPGSIGGGIFLARILRPSPSAGSDSTSDGRMDRRGRVRYGFREVPIVGVAVVLLLVGSSLFSAVAVLGPSNPYNEPLASDLLAYNANQRPYSLSLISQVATYIDSSTPTGATVFTGDLAFITTADRPNLMNLTIIVDLYDRPASFNGLPLGTSPHDIAPSWAQIFERWNSTSVPMVVVGDRTRSLETNFPYLSTYIESRYVLVQTFGDQITPSAVQIWALGRPPSAGTLAASVPGPGTSGSATIYDARANVVAASAWNSSTIELYNGSTMAECGQFALPAPIVGVRTLAFDPATGQLWVAALSAHVVVESITGVCSASRSFEENLSSSPTAIVFDPGPGVALVISRSASMAHVFNTSSGASVLSFSTVSNPAALGVDPGEGEVFIASGSSDALSVYNISTGLEAATFALGFEANNVEVDGTSLVVTWAATGLVEWLNQSNGQVLGSTSVGPQVQGIAVSHGSLALGSYSSGKVSFFDLGNRTYFGSLSTGACPASLSFLGNARTLSLTGACAGSVEQWTLQPLINLTIALGGSGAVVTVDRLPVSLGSPLTLLPGQYSINVTVPGSPTDGFLLSLSKDTTWSPSFDASVSSVRSLQIVFETSATTAAILIGVLVLFVPPPPGPRRERID
ncbi:MAG: glycosyltransferase family 39 protein [Thermoplasmata archaeon]